MRVDLFDFELNKDLIAKEPVSPRHNSKLLDLSDEIAINDKHFYDLPNILQPGDVLVFNNTKVIPARLYGKRGEAEVEVTLYHPENGQTWWSFIKNSKRLKAGDVVSFYTSDIPAEKSQFKARVIEKRGEDGVLLEFLCDVKDMSKMLETYGMMPLPPYIKREKPVDGIWNKYNDKENYQTVYAKNEGAVAAPTAGLHFTDEILKKISGDESPDGIVCIMGCIDKSEKIDKIYNNTLCDGIKGGVIILDSVRDPGNMGTVIRTAYAFGTGLIIASPDCADIYSPKVQRGAMGAAFSQSLITKPTADAVKELRENGFSVYAAALHHDSLDIRDVKMNEKTAFVIGNEGNGLSEEIIDLCTGSVIIPIQKHSESLNAAIASSIIMWEMAKK